MFCDWNKPQIDWEFHRKLKGRCKEKHYSRGSELALTPRLNSLFALPLLSPLAARHPQFSSRFLNSEPAAEWQNPHLRRPWRNRFCVLIVSCSWYLIPEPQTEKYLLPPGKVACGCLTCFHSKGRHRRMFSRIVKALRTRQVNMVPFWCHCLKRSKQGQRSTGTSRSVSRWQLAKFPVKKILT